MEKTEYGVFQYTVEDCFLRSLLEENARAYQCIDAVGFGDRPASGAYRSAKLLFRSHDIVECWDFISQDFDNPVTKKHAELFLESI